MAMGECARARWILALTDGWMMNAGSVVSRREFDEYTRHQHRDDDAHRVGDEAAAQRAAEDQRFRPGGRKMVSREGYVEAGDSSDEDDSSSSRRRPRRRAGLLHHALSRHAHVRAEEQQQQQQQQQQHAQRRRRPQAAQRRHVSFQQDRGGVTANGDDDDDDDDVDSADTPPPPPPPSVPPPTDDSFGQLDTNGDGVLTREEFYGRRRPGYASDGLGPPPQGDISRASGGVASTMGRGYTQPAEDDAGYDSALSA
jgi:hypothetical protein